MGTLIVKEVSDCLEVPDTGYGDTFYFCRDEQRAWFRCPCQRCADNPSDGMARQGIVIPVDVGDNKGWTLTIEADGLPTLTPSINRTGACNVHFFLRHGKYEIC